MARKITDKSIEFDDGESRVFRIQQMRVRDGHAVIERIAMVAGPVLGALAGGLGQDADRAVVGDLSEAGVREAFEALSSNLMANEGTVDWLVGKLRGSIKYQSDGGIFVTLTEDLYDDLFAGDYLAEGKLVAAALSHNFASFFKGAGGLAAAARKFVTPTQSRSSSRRGANSGSGDL